MSGPPSVPPGGGRRRRPFLVLGLVVGGLVGLWALVFLGLLAHPRSRAVIDQAFEFGRALSTGMNAPGTDALRALGCDEAAVLPLGQALAVAKMMGSDEVELTPERAGTPWVFCRRTSGGDAPTCDEVAATFVTATSPDRTFLAGVHHPGETQCAGYYEPTGEWIGDVGSNFELVEPAPP